MSDTRAKQQEEFARERELLKAIIDAIPVMVVLYDPNLEGFQLNPECERVFGWTTEDTRHRDLMASVYPDPDYRRQVVEYMQSLEPGWRDITMVAKDGSRVETSWANVGLSGDRRVGIGVDIRQRKRAEQVLRESEAFTRHVLNNLFAFVGVLELDGTLVEANRAPLEAAGITIDDVRGRKFWDCYWWDYSEEIRTQLREACARAATGELIRYDVPVRVAGDSRIIIDFQIAPLRNVAGEVTYLIPSAVDVTERTRAEEALRQSESFYRQTLESIPGMIFTTRPDGYCDYQSSQWVEFTGVAMDKHLGDGWNSLLHPEDRPVAMAAWQAAVREEAPYDLEYRVRRHDGAYEWFKVRGRPIRDAEGRIARWFGVAANIDVLKRTEAEAARSRLWLERVADTTPDVIFVYDILRDRNVYVNRGLTPILEFTPEQFRNLSSVLANVTAPEDLPRVTQFYRDMASAAPGEVRVLTQRSPSQDGELRWIECHVTPFSWDEGGRLVEVIGVASDITERKHAEDALRQTRDELEQRVRERTAELQRRADQLARMTSELTLAEQRERRRLAQVLHDHLQQLLVGAKFGLAVVERRVGEAHRQPVEEVQGLISEAINASRSLTVELSPPILHEAGLPTALEWLARWMKDKHGLEVTLEADSSATTEREDVRILVFQATRELLFNVVKHAQVTRAALTLAAAGDDTLAVTVQDSGCGFDVRTVLGQSGALRDGFGLASIRERLTMLGGRLDVTSAVGAGAKFTIIAPTRPTQAAAQQQAVQAAAQPAGVGRRSVRSRRGRRGAKIRLLLVDDHAVVRQGLSSLLTEEPDLQIVAEASDGLEALELTRKLRPDVVLMDFSMPKMDGVEATRRIRAEMPDMKVIGLSMYEEADRAAAMIGAGAFAYLSKSGESVRLIETIRKVHQAPATGQLKPMVIP